MINFDDKFKDFVRKWFSENEGKYTPEQMEERIQEIFDAWADGQDKELGASPRGYFQNIKSAEALIKLLRDYREAGVPYPTLLLDRIVEEKACESYLIGMLSEEEGGEKDCGCDEACDCGCQEGEECTCDSDCLCGDSLVMLAANLLAEMNSRKPYDIYIDWIFNREKNSAMRELAAEILCHDAEFVKEKILAKVPSGDYTADDWAAVILVNCPKDKRIVKFLIDMFMLGKDGPLYALYLGKYGDTDAIPYLYEAAKTCDYMTFVDVIAALEELGETPDIKRDFSNDRYYRKLNRGN
jgi:hypothetical protein